MFGALALGFALWFSWSHWVDLSHHWTQRDLFWRYYDRRKPGEPIVAYMMDWQGETFYSRNTVKQIKDSPQRMAAFANLARSKVGAGGAPPAGRCSARRSAPITASSRWTGTST